MNSVTKEKFDLLVSSLKSDFSNENLHNVLIDYCIENSLEMELINYYKEKKAEFPEICDRMLERLAERSVKRLYETKIKKRTDEDKKNTTIKLILILLATIIAMFFIWRGLLSAFKSQFNP
jgi:hypothetical protein